MQSVNKNAFGNTIHSLFLERKTTTHLMDAPTRTTKLKKK